MKQKIVISVSMNDEKSRSKALKTVVGVSGVESVALKGDQVEVVGDGIDAMVLTRALRKCVASANLIGVGEAKNIEEKKAETSAPPVDWSYFPQPHDPVYVHPSPDPSCIIM